MKRIFIVTLTILTAGILFSADRFTDNGKGTVTDNETKLIWQKCSLGQDAVTCSGTAELNTWGDAITYCNSLKLAGRRWRLPSLDELKTLIVTGPEPTINKSFFPNTKSSYYWSSSTFVGNTTLAWYVDFYNGNVFNTSKTITTFVRCVSGP